MDVSVASSWVGNTPSPTMALCALMKWTESEEEEYSPLQVDGIKEETFLSDE